MSFVASNIKKIIERKGLKQKVVAQRAGFGEKMFSNLLHGRKTIKAEMIPEIVKALEIQPNELFEGLEEELNVDNKSA